MTEKLTKTTPTIFVILGITGDLAQRKLLPALLDLYAKNLLSEKFRIVGFSRRSFSRDEFRSLLDKEMKYVPEKYTPEMLQSFFDSIDYIQGFFDQQESYNGLTSHLKAIDESFGQCSNKLFHLSVAPDHYEVVLNNLSYSGLTIPCGGDEGWTRVLVEKPFGNNIETAQKLDALLGTLFKEEQIFRIDHYLAKETVQNILAFRFFNTLFKPIWSKNYVTKVEIDLFETLDIEGRGSFYDKIGAIRDVGQNHMLQLLAIIAMDEPDTLEGKSIRAERAKILSTLIPIKQELFSRYVKRGQYEGYLHEDGVGPQSQTETYFEIEASLSTERWKGIPFVLKAGKAMNQSKVEIRVYVKNEIDAMAQQNVLTFGIQPHESITLSFWVKVPGLGMEMRTQTLTFNYDELKSKNIIPDAYEKVLYDAICGDQTLFMSTDEVMAQWKFISPIITALQSTTLLLYKKGSSGPVSDEYIDSENE